MSQMLYKPLGDVPGDSRLGRFIPDDFKHIESYPYRAIAPTAVTTVEETLRLPYWHATHDQGYTGSCVGHASAFERAVTNSAQNRVARIFRGGRRYDPLHIWENAKAFDEWPDTNPGDDNGTSVRAAYDVLRNQGARVIRGTGIKLDTAGRPEVIDTKNAPDPNEGVETNRWAQNSDEIRTAIANGLPVVIGISWYSNFDNPISVRGRFGRSEYWIGQGDLGRIRGGHAVCLYGASDRRAAFKMKNSWGKDYPLVWLPYSTMDRLLNEYGEACLVVDR